MTNQHLILPLSLEGLRERAQAALERFQGSPIRKTHKITQFLTDLLGYDNEHVMAAEQGAPLRLSGQIEVVSVTLIETDGDNDRIIRTTTHMYAGMAAALEGLPGLFTSEAGDHDGVATDIAEAAGLDTEDEAVAEALEDFDLDRLAALALDEHGGEDLMGRILAHVSFGRVRGSMTQTWLDVDLPLEGFALTRGKA